VRQEVMRVLAGPTRRQARGAAAAATTESKERKSSKFSTNSGATSPSTPKRTNLTR